MLGFFATIALFIMGMFEFARGNMSSSMSLLLVSALFYLSWTINCAVTRISNSIKEKGDKK